MGRYDGEDYTDAHYTKRRVSKLEAENARLRADLDAAEQIAKVNYGLYKSATADLDAALTQVAQVKTFRDKADRVDDLEAKHAAALALADEWKQQAERNPEAKMLWSVARSRLRAALGHTTNGDET
jgi:hypothetical protein